MRIEEKAILQMSQFLQFQQPIVELMEEAKKNFNLKTFCEKLKASCQQRTLPLKQAPALEKLIRILAKGVGTVKNLEDTSSDMNFIVEQIQNIIRLLFALGLYIDKQPRDDHSLTFKIRLLILIHKICILFPQENNEISHFRRESYYQHAISYFTYGRIVDKPLCGTLDMAFQYPSSGETQTAIQEIDWIGRLINQFDDKFDKAAGGLQHKLIFRFVLLSHKMINIFSSLSDSVLESDRLIAYGMLVTGILKGISFSLALKKYLYARFLAEQITDIVLNATIDEQKITPSSRAAILKITGDILQVYAYILGDYPEIFLLISQINNYFIQKNPECSEDKRAYTIKKIPAHPPSDSSADSPKEVKELLEFAKQSSVTEEQRDIFLNQVLGICLGFDLQSEERQALEWLSVSIQVSQAYIDCRDFDWENMNVFAGRCLYLFLKYRTKIGLTDIPDYEHKLKVFTEYLAACSDADCSGQRPVKVSHEQFLPLKSKISTIISAIDKRLFLQEDSKKWVIHVKRGVSPGWLFEHKAVSQKKVIIEDLLRLAAGRKDPEVLRNHITVIANFLIMSNKLLKELPQQQYGDFELRAQAVAFIEEICLLFNDDVEFSAFLMWAYYLGIENYLIHRQYNHLMLDSLFEKALEIKCIETDQKLKEIDFIYQLSHDCLFPYASERTDIITIIDKFSVKMIDIFLVMKIHDFEKGEQDQFLVYFIVVNNILTIINDGCKMSVSKKKSTNLSSIICLIPSLYALIAKSHKAELLTEGQSLIVLQAIMNFFKIPGIFDIINKKSRWQLFEIVKKFTPKEIKNPALSQCSLALSFFEHKSQQDRPPPKIEEKILTPNIIKSPIMTPPPQPIETILIQPAKVDKSFTEQMHELKQINAQVMASSTAKTEDIRRFKTSLRNLRKKNKQEKRQVAELKAALAQRDEKLAQAARQPQDSKISQLEYELQDAKAKLVIAKQESHNKQAEAERLTVELATTKQKYDTLLQQTTSAPLQNPTILQLEQELQELRAELATAKQKIGEISTESKQSLAAALTKVKENYDAIRIIELTAENSLKYSQAQYYQNEIAKLQREITQLRQEVTQLQPSRFYEAWRSSGFQYASPPVPVVTGMYEFRAA